MVDDLPGRWQLYSHNMWGGLQLVNHLMHLTTTVPCQSRAVCCLSEVFLPMY